MVEGVVDVCTRMDGSATVGLGYLCFLLSDRTSSAHSSVALRIVLFLLYVELKDKKSGT